jgi:predicted nucleic acid-binding protein
MFGLVLEDAVSAAKHACSFSGGKDSGVCEPATKTASPGTRRILADFIIGAHAQHHGFRMLILDEGLYRAAFPRLRMLSA